MNYFPSKFLTASLLIVGALITEPALSAESVGCELNESLYTFSADGQYHLESKKVISRKTSKHHDTVVTLTDLVPPVSYSVSFTPGRKIEGRLSLNIIQPGQSQFGTVDDGDTLHLWIEEDFEDRATVYTLDCQFEP